MTAKFYYDGKWQVNEKAAPAAKVAPAAKPVIKPKVQTKSKVIEG